MYTEPAQTRFSWTRSPTVEQAGLQGLKNGALIRQASSRFEVLITVDQNLPFQQNITDNSIAIIILMGKSKSVLRLEDASAESTSCASHNQSR
jgi:hypothetical protein